MKKAAFWALDLGWKKIRLRDKHPVLHFWNLSSNFQGLKIVEVADTDPESSAFMTQDPGRKNKDPETKFLYGISRRGFWA